MRVRSRLETHQQFDPTRKENNAPRNVIFDEVTTLEELKDELLGEVGTEDRDEYEKELQDDLTKTEVKEVKPAKKIKTKE